MAIVLDCPSCNRKLRVPDEMMGRKVKCPECGTAFTADERREAALRDRPSGPGQLQREEPPEEDDRPPSRRSGEDDDDFIYRPERRSRFRTAADPGRGAVVLVLGIFSIVLALFAGVGLLFGACCLLPVGGIPALIGLPMGIVSWAMGQRDLQRIRQGLIDPAAHGSTVGGLVCAIIGTVLNAIGAIIGLVMLVALLGCMGAMFQSMPGPTPKTSPPPRKVERIIEPPKSLPLAA